MKRTKRANAVMSTSRRRGAVAGHFYTFWGEPFTQVYLTIFKTGVASLFILNFLKHLIVIE